MLAPLLAWALAANAAQPIVDAYRQALLTEQDPVVAEKLLASRGDQDALKTADPAAFTALFEKALELKDVRGFFDDFKQDPHGLRQALTARTRSSLCSSPAQLLAWRTRHFPAMQPDILEEAVWEWPYLDPSQQAHLASRGVDAAVWKTFSSHRRQSTLGEWGRARLKGLLQRAPKNSAEYAAVSAEASLIAGSLSEDEQDELNDFLSRSKTAVSALSDAERQLAKTADPALKALLDKAKAAGDTAGTLDALDKLFDGMKVDRKDVEAAKESAPSEAMTDAQKAMLVPMLKTGLLKTVEGTTPGDKLLTFYSKERLEIEIVSLGSGSVAQYSGKDRKIRFNQDVVEEYIRTNDLTVDRLAGDAKAFGALTNLMSSSFVHEATHHEHDLWELRHGVTLGSLGQHRELETMQRQGLFVAEKMALDPSYRGLINANRQHVSMAKNAYIKADMLLRPDGGEKLREDIRTGYYPHLLSLEGKVFDRSKRNAERAAEIDAEIALRKRGAGRSPAFAGESEADLAFLLQYNRDQIQDMPRQYELWRERLEKESADTDSQARKVRLGLLKPRKKVVVPSPMIP